MKQEIPEIIKDIVSALLRAGFEAFLVGGCVRDLLLDKKPKDWDITTNANPEQIQALFPKTVYENKFGTVAVITDSDDETLKVVEITPYRLESKYTDKRHPDEVSFTCNLEDDLKRRDFTINAMALSVSKGSKGNPWNWNFQGLPLEIIDLFDGKNDLKNKVIRAVGEPERRFDEDGLRILRAIRLATELGFDVSHETQEAIKKQAHLLEIIAKERIKDEFVKIIMSDNPVSGVKMAQELGILRFIVPELEQGIGIEQNKSHKYKVWEHNLASLEHTANKKWSLEIRLAALFHDIGKPASRRWSEEKKDWTFYGHDIIGAKMTFRIMERLRFSKKITELVAKLVRYHLFFSDTEKITLSAVRRTVRNVGPENIWDLMKVRFSDRIGMARPKETPYRLRKYEAMIEEVMRSPLSVGMLKIDGNRLMELLKIPAGPKIGQILHILLDEILDDNGKNTEIWLETRTKELGRLGDAELKKLGDKAKNKKDDIESGEISHIRQKWGVK
jgi:poly(A) polymerase/tRNA nucleotidyltransferase (CCA-adding enzyme)